MARKLTDDSRAVASNGDMMNDMTQAEEQCILSVEDLWKSFGTQEVLRGISFKVFQQEVIAIIGPSGGGKSTLLRCMNCLETPDKGVIRMEGRPVGLRLRNGKLVKERERYIRKHRAEIGMVFQQFNLFPHMTVLENIIEAPIAVHGKKKAEAINDAMKLMAKVHLFNKENSYPAQLSGGEQQRVAIARALIMLPKVMLFDEVTSALDPETVGEVLKVMEELAAEGMTMLIVAHEMTFVRAAAKRVLFLYNGTILEEGSPSEILDNPQDAITQRFLARLK